MNEYKLSASLEEHDDDVKRKPFNVSPFMLTDLLLGARSRFPSSKCDSIRLQRLYSSPMETDVSESSKV